MYDDEEPDRSRSFNSQLADALSPDPARNSVIGENSADAVSQSIANELADNHPDEWERAAYGNGTPASNTMQNWLDERNGLG